MKITWFGHSAFRLDFSGHAVLIDPTATEAVEQRISRLSELLQLPYFSPLEMGRKGLAESTKVRCT